MTSLRQIEANRRNALGSTGPRTEEGKRRSRKNAVRHGLCAETVVETLEDADDYRGFEAAVIAGYDARTAVERELVLRLASLLWRLRRATAIETDLVRIQAEILREPRSARPTSVPNSPRVVGNALAPRTETCASAERDGCSVVSSWEPTSTRPQRQLTVTFQRLANLDGAVFDRLERYEARLMRQVFRTIYLLRSTGCRT